MICSSVKMNKSHKISKRFHCVMSQMKENKFLNTFIIYYFLADVIHCTLYLESYGRINSLVIYFLCTLYIK